MLATLYSDFQLNFFCHQDVSLKDACRWIWLWPINTCALPPWSDTQLGWWARQRRRLKALTRGRNESEDQRVSAEPLFRTRQQTSATTDGVLSENLRQQKPEEEEEQIEQPWWKDRSVPAAERGSGSIDIYSQSSCICCAYSKCLSWRCHVCISVVSKADCD